MLKDRYAIVRTMKANDIERVLSTADTIVELTLAVLAYENPAAMSPRYQKETCDDIFNFFREHAPLEFQKFADKVQSYENQQDSGDTATNKLSGLRNRSMPDRYEMESKIATLIDDCTPEMLNDPYASIVMDKNYELAWTAISKDFESKIGEGAPARVYLKEVNSFSLLKMCKEQGMSSRDPAAYMLTDMYAKAVLDLLLKRIGN